MKINRFVFFIISLTISLASSILFTVSYEQMILDPEYVKSLNLPTNGDSFGIALAASMVISMILILFNLCCYIIFFILCFTIIKDKKIEIYSLLLKRGEIALNIVRVIGYLIIVLLNIGYILGFSKFYVAELLFYVTTIFAVISYVLWITTIFKKKVYIRRYFYMYVI